MLANSLAEQQALVSRLTDQQLQFELQNPSGVAPTYLLMSEMQKRQQARQAGMGSPQQSPLNTVRMQMIQKAQGGPPQQPGSLTQPMMPSAMQSANLAAFPAQMPRMANGGPVGPSIAPQFSGRVGIGFANGGPVRHYDDGGLTTGAGMGQMMINTGAGALQSLLGGFNGLLQGGGQHPAPVAPAPLPVAAAKPVAPAAAAQQDSAQSPLGYTPADIDALVRMTYGEGGSEPTKAQQAIAGVALNRARQTGLPFSQIVSQPDQFQGYNKSALDLDPSSKAYQTIYQNILPVVTGAVPNPAGTADHFYTPAEVQSKPGWDNGSGQKIGNELFFSLGYDNKTPGVVPGGIVDAAKQGQATDPISLYNAMQRPTQPDLGALMAQFQGGVSDPSQAYAGLANQYSKILQDSSKQSKALALMKMGAAMMSAPTPNFLTALGYGANAGLGDYQQSVNQQRQLQLEAANAAAQQQVAHSQWQQGNLKDALTAYGNQMTAYNDAQRNNVMLADSQGRTGAEYADQALRQQLGNQEAGWHTQDVNNMATQRAYDSLSNEWDKEHPADRPIQVITLKDNSILEAPMGTDWTKIPGAVGGPRPATAGEQEKLRNYTIMSRMAALRSQMGGSGISIDAANDATNSGINGFYHQ